MAAGLFSYDLTATGPESFQVSVVDPVHGTHLIGNFRSLGAAETFADDMRRIDASPSHGAAGYRIEPLIRQNHCLLAAAAKARSQIKQTRMKSAHIRAEIMARYTWWQWFREAKRRRPSSFHKPADGMFRQVMRRAKGT